MVPIQMGTPHARLAHVEGHDLVVSFALVETRHEDVVFGVGDPYRHR